MSANGVCATARCGVCERPAEVIATAPMCGEQPRYPMCLVCFEDINDCGYAEDVTYIGGRPE